MKKRILLTIFIIALTACLLMSFTACNDDTLPNGDTPGGNIPGTPPTASDWESAGLGSSFGASVSGTLTSSAAVDNEIYMKWEKSDKASFDDTVNWLQTQGYTQFSGMGAEVEAEGGMVTYTSEKLNKDGKNTIVEVVYITQDIAIAGQSFKAGDLYFSVTPQEAPSSPGTGGTATWPANQIQAALGVALPEYSGKTTQFVFSDASYGSIKNIGVTAYGAPEGADTAYIALLIQNGYTESDGTYVKQLANGDYVDVYVYYSQTMNPTTYQTDYALQINAAYNKNSGSYTAWNKLDLSDFKDASIPSFNGGTSFDFEDIGDATRKAQSSALQQAIAILSQYESMLDDEEKAELAALRAKLPYVEQIEAVMITVYGANDGNVEAYLSALESAGFEYGEKDTSDFQYTADISSIDDNGKTTITFTKTPQALLEESGGGTQEPTPDYTIPTNLKATYISSGLEYTAIKIGEDYYFSYGMGGYTIDTYYKKNGNAWDIYEKGFGATDWNKEASQENDVKYIEHAVFDFMVTQADIDSDAVKGAAQSILGRSCDTYTLEYSGITDTYFKDVETGLILKYTSSYGFEYSVKSFDTTVTGFDGITLPQ